MIKVDESEEVLWQQLEQARAKIRETFAVEYEADPTMSMFESVSEIEQDTEPEIRIEYDWDDVSEKK